MATYLLVPTAKNAVQLDVAVCAKFDASNRFAVPNQAGWLVQFPGTTVEVSNHAGITGQGAGEISLVGSVIVTLVTSYYGRGSSEMWEWLKTRMEAG